MSCFLGSGHDAQDFTALSDRAGLLVRHHTLGGGDDHGAHATEDLRQLVLAAVDPQSRTADTLDPVDDRTAFVILQSDRQRRLAAVGLRPEVCDVALVLQYLDDGRLQLRVGELNLTLASGLAIANASQQISDGVSHAHTASLTSSPS